jgi:hypothetical protein
MVQQVADPVVVQASCEMVFFQMMLTYYPMLLVKRADPGSGNYPNIVRLFEAWFTEKNHNPDAMRQRVRSAWEELRNGERRRAATRLAPPLGTED